MALLWALTRVLLWALLWALLWTLLWILLWALLLTLLCRVLPWRHAPMLTTLLWLRGQMPLPLSGVTRK